MKEPEDFEGLMDMLETFHGQLRGQIAMLPPTPAKQLMDQLLDTVQPMVGELRTAFPEANEAFKTARSDIDAMINDAQSKIDQAKQNLAEMPPVEEIKKNLVPLAATIPDGLTLQYADEMRDRYFPLNTDPAIDDAPGAAWQDWSMQS
ncbi:MAG: hypothetical protein R3C05_30055 [Pirellulaceae bacterium]